MLWLRAEVAACRLAQFTTFPTHSAQALPYSWTLFYVPMHFLTHEMLLFFTSIWTTNIHDNIHAKVGGWLALFCWVGLA